METEDDFGTNCDGSKNSNYCVNCYEKGNFIGNDSEKIEINTALEIIKLLKQYDATTTQTEKDFICKQIACLDDFVVYWLKRLGASPIMIIKRIEKAISLNEYRPKNISICHFAHNKDLNYIQGDFSTFDAELSKRYKNKTSFKEICARFKFGTSNTVIMAKQFAIYWIKMLNNHKDLVAIARKSNESTVFDAYNKLFNALNADFCAKYNCKIDLKLVTDWEHSDLKPESCLDVTFGIHDFGYKLHYPINISKEQQNQILQDFNKKPSEHPYARRESLIRICLANIRKTYKKSNDFFCFMIAGLAHEMHHALDFEQPRKGIIGEQIEFIDRKTYVGYEENPKAYCASATEISSYTIQTLLFNLLKRARF